MATAATTLSADYQPLISVSHAFPFKLSHPPALPVKPSDRAPLPGHQKTSRRDQRRSSRSRERKQVYPSGSIISSLCLISTLLVIQLYFFNVQVKELEETALALLNATHDCVRFSSAVKSVGEAYVPGTQVIIEDFGFLFELIFFLFFNGASRF